MEEIGCLSVHTKWPALGKSGDFLLKWLNYSFASWGEKYSDELKAPRDFLLRTLANVYK